MLLATGLLLLRKRGQVHLVDLRFLAGWLRGCRGLLLLIFAGFRLLCSPVVLWLLLLKDALQRQGFARFFVHTVVNTLLLITIIIRLKECFLRGDHVLRIILRKVSFGCCFRLCFPLGCLLHFRLSLCLCLCLGSLFLGWIFISIWQLQLQIVNCCLPQPSTGFLRFLLFFTITLIMLIVFLPHLLINWLLLFPSAFSSPL